MAKLSHAPHPHPERTDAGAEGLPLREIGKCVKEPRLRIAGKASDWIVWAKLADLKEAWQKPLRW